MITDAGGIPLAATLTGGNRHDVTQLLPLIEAIPPVRGRCGRPRQRPVQVFADRACDHDKYRALVRARGIEPVIALLHWFRRLRIRWEIRDDIHEAFLSLGCAVICWRRLKIYSLC